MRFNFVFLPHILTGKIYLKIKSIIEKLSLSNISHQLNVFSKIPISLLKIIVASFLIICLFVFTYYTYLEFKKNLVIEVIDFPKALQEKGYTNQTFKKMIIEKLNLIEESARTTFPSYDTSLEAPLESESAKNQNLPRFERSKRFVDVSGENPPRLEVKLEGISIPIDSFINFFVEYIKRFLGCPRTHVVCNVTMQGNSENLKIITQIDRNLVKINNGSLENLDSTMAAITEYIYKCKEPFVLAQHLYINGRQEDCLEIINYCIKNNPLSYGHSAYNLWGRILYKVYQDYDNAIKKYKMATRLNPKFAPAYYNWGLALQDKGQKYYEDAIVQYKKALDNAEQDALRAPAHFNLGLILTTQGSILSGQGEKDVAKEKYQKATENYQMALKYAPLSAHPGIYQNLGAVLSEQEDYDNEIEMYKKAIEINPLFTEIYHNWGLALYQNKEYEKAIEKLETATEIKPMANTYYMWGLALYDWGIPSHDKNKIKEAIEKYNKTLDLDPDFAPAYHYLGVALSSQKRDFEACKNFKKASEKDPKDIRTYIEWGNILCKRKKYRKAIRIYKKGLEHVTDNQLADKVNNYINELTGITKKSHLK